MEDQSRTGPGGPLVSHWPQPREDAQHTRVWRRRIARSERTRKPGSSLSCWCPVPPRCADRTGHDLGQGGRVGRARAGAGVRSRVVCSGNDPGSMGAPTSRPGRSDPRPAAPRSGRARPGRSAPPPSSRRGPPGRPRGAASTGCAGLPPGPGALVRSEGHHAGRPGAAQPDAAPLGVPEGAPGHHRGTGNRRRQAGRTGSAAGRGVVRPDRPVPGRGGAPGCGAGCSGWYGCSSAHSVVAGATLFSGPAAGGPRARWPCRLCGRRSRR